jgi:hypothetical protein
VKTANFTDDRHPPAGRFVLNTKVKWTPVLGPEAKLEKGPLR